MYVDRPHGTVPTNGAYCTGESDSIMSKYQMISSTLTAHISMNLN